jgi:aspartyl-tRNA(Asn)/glutamyl-tRNA(Gln) amidotransferase subunit B
MNIESVIGIEVHVELSTSHKMFSTSKNNIYDASNSNVNVNDIALPGTLPRVNMQAVEYALKAALALNCEITQKMHFDRKNYFYFDNAKQYQITQNETPIGKNGYVEILDASGQTKKIGIERIHIEEDTAKSTHFENHTRLDYNRAGIPLVEIVSTPDIRSPKEAYEFLRNLKLILEKIQISDLKMEDGSLRCDANISIRPRGASFYNDKVEVKNLNSFAFAEKALEYEYERQLKAFLAGEEVEQSTRRYDEATKTTVLMRKKQGKADYHYQYEPDIPPIYISNEQIEQTKKTLPLNHIEEYRNLVSEGITSDDAIYLVFNRDMFEFYTKAKGEKGDGQKLLNFMKTEIQTILKKDSKEFNQIIFSTSQVSDIITLLDSNQISNKIAREVYTQVYQNPELDVNSYVKEKGLIQITDPEIIGKAVDQVISENPSAIEEISQGKKNLYGFLVGQVIKIGQGKFEPALINKLMQERINRK